ncbi:Dual specificity protein phosphatase 1B [Fulvia fulva]|uniref:Dual specificity protein phosphatase 1B n=1 Tax=Passalora fulva TaxID=5499 RepID=A0A9Q8UQQ5_PASFU|nr:Dual specificity protein phosphatase 1B [Fulvia fulva]KAK4622250.1 Dual specificity protein phosphatase 1B [Fulvia fulva]KAK4622387.1 Dual specificity protein phosphatase 1B [Fulvia fulva]UJO18912.1 Dual specificity protein phosphatase 1B [Fulvia fulva]WPV16316.1 Dual specificity protein phosphatase 1B [Fulvia fulva]WPV30903.1 Dual specificity protein phosphatase 1B [Fulvia fulva]
MSRFWEFQQLQDSWKGASHFDQVPRAGKLYIGGVAAFYKEPDPLEQAGITHILSVLDFSINDAPQLKRCKCLNIQVDDDPDEDLLKHFPKTNAFLDDALREGGGVFVHCAMGVSRSATVICAYLIWKFGLSPMEALEKVREKRKRANPNPGFMRQLKVWERMCREKQGWDGDVYREWKEGGGKAKM